MSLLPYRPVHYETLDITVRDPLYRVAHNGPVRNIRNYVEQRFPDMAGSLDRALGAQITVPTKRGIDHHIIYTEQDKDWATLYVSAHEEGHSLHAANVQRTGLSRSPISQLEEKLEDLGVRLDLSRFRDYKHNSEADRETFANLCGLYALHRKGIDVAYAGRLLVDRYNAPQMREALELYLKGMARDKTTPASNVVEMPRRGERYRRPRIAA
jgi:hypothetical protein